MRNQYLYREIIFKFWHCEIHCGSNSVNAWEEGDDEVVLYTSRIAEVDLEAVGGPVKESFKPSINQL